MKAAFFDMDHTLLRVDSSMSWMRFLRRRGELSPLFSLRALWWSLQYKLALLDLDTLAERLVGDVRGDAESEMIDKARTWHELELAHQVFPRAKQAIADHRRQGDVIVLLTGGGQFAANNVAQMLGIEHVLCTELEVRGGRFTGNIAQRCFGTHKPRVAEAWAASHDIDLGGSVFYSDSYNDLPMLSRVGDPVAVNPDIRLLGHARQHGWRVERWD